MPMRGNGLTCQSAPITDVAFVCPHKAGAGPRAIAGTSGHLGRLPDDELPPHRRQHENRRFLSFLWLSGPKGYLGVRGGHPVPQLGAGVP